MARLYIIASQGLAVCFVVLLFTTSVFADGLEGCEEHIKYGVPSQEETLLCRLGYALSHNAVSKISDWVAYHLTKEKVAGTHPRSNNFKADPDLEIESRARLKDYKGSGYDRGHMAPAAAMKWSEKAMRESFFLSNMAPQVGIGFNRHIWKSLETKVRNWTSERGELYIVTGPIFKEDFTTIGLNKVVVPTHFFKVIFDPSRYQAIAFILQNKKLKTADLAKYIASIDEVETLTGLDFLSNLEDEMESAIEVTKQSRLW